MIIYGFATVGLQILALCLQSSTRFTVQIMGPKRPLRRLKNASRHAFVSSSMESRTVGLFLGVCSSWPVQWPPKPNCS